MRVRQPQAGAIQPVKVRPKLRSSVRLVASVAWLLATVVTKRTELWKAPRWSTLVKPDR
jgi:hypothetical protein